MPKNSIVVVMLVVGTLGLYSEVTESYLGLFPLLGIDSESHERLGGVDLSVSNAMHVNLCVRQKCI